MGYAFREGEKVYLRSLEPDDAERCVRWVNDPELSQFLLVGRAPMSLQMERDWVMKMDRSQTDVVFGICLTENDLHIGNCGLHGIDNIDHHATAGIVIGERSLHGKGYGSDAMSLLIDYGFKTLNLERIMLTVFDFNTRAKKSYDKLGFVEEGRMRRHRFRHGEYHDEVVMGLLRTEWAGR